MATGQFSSLLDVEIPIPVGRNFNFLLKPVEEPVNWFTALLTVPRGAREIRDDCRPHSSYAAHCDHAAIIRILKD